MSTSPDNSVIASASADEAASVPITTTRFTPAARARSRACDAEISISLSPRTRSCRWQWASVQLLNADLDARKERFTLLDRVHGAVAAPLCAGGEDLVAR